MKNKIIMMSMLATSFFIGCSDNTYEAPNSFSEVGWYTSALRAPASTLNVGINNYMSFVDLSQGTKTHSWTIDEGNLFLQGPIPTKQKIFDKYIKEPVALTSTDKTIHVLFKKSGIQNVKLFNTFKDSVAFRGADGLIISSVKVGDEWVIDKTFAVDVYDTIVPKMVIKRDGVVLSHENATDVITIEAGDKLEFTDITTIGRPTGSSWKIGTATGLGRVSNIIFKKLGTFKGSFTVGRTAQYIPTDIKTYQIPATFKVVPSSKPFVLTGDIKELANETIQVPFNGEFEPFANKESSFTVKVNNIVFPIKTVTVNAADATVLDIVLKDKIYRPDVITVSYDGTGGITSTDLRTPAVFTNKAVIMHNVNMLDNVNAGFEDGKLTGWSLPWDSDAVISASTTRAATGTYSLKMVCDGVERQNPANYKNSFEGLKSKFNLQKGKTYILTFKIYREVGAKLTDFAPWLLTQWKQFWTPGADAIVGQWTTITKEHTATGDNIDFYFMFQINGGSGVFYFDDIFLVEKEVRP